MPEVRDTNTLLEQLREIVKVLNAGKIRFALIGGMAVSVRARPRATQDLDFLAEGRCAQQVSGLLRSLGYTVLDERKDLASFVRGDQRVDFLFANHPRSTKFLEAADPVMLPPEVPVVSTEALVALKLQAYTDDPRRLRDLSDIMDLIRYNRCDLDMAQLRSYFALFDQETFFDEILSRLT